MDSFPNVSISNDNESAPIDIEIKSLVNPSNIICPSWHNYNINKLIY